MVCKTHKILAFYMESVFGERVFGTKSAARLVGSTETGGMVGIQSRLGQRQFYACLLLWRQRLQEQ